MGQLVSREEDPTVKEDNEIDEPTTLEELPKKKQRTGGRSKKVRMSLQTKSRRKKENS
jgi:hypothetical protein